MENPGCIHWEAVKHVLRYLKGMCNWKLVYGGGEAHGLEGFMDANGAMQEHRRAISGHVILIDRGAISWCSKKQELVTLSTTEVLAPFWQDLSTTRTPRRSSLRQPICDC